MRKTLFLILILAFLITITGCMEGNESDSSDNNQTSQHTLEIENKFLHDQVTQLNSQMQATELKYQELQKSSESRQLEEQKIAVKYPKLAAFTSAQDYLKIEINDSKGNISITEPTILTTIANMFIIKEEVMLGSGPQADIEPIQYLLTTPQGIINVGIVQQGIITFEDLYPGIYFNVDINAYQLGKAFMNRPSYMTNESVILKMVNSGLLKVSGEKNTFYLYTAGRIRSVALAFFNSKKSESAKPKNSLTAVLKTTFYYYGEEIQLNMFNGKLQLKSNSGEIWYDIDDEEYLQIQLQITAS